MAWRSSVWVRWLGWTALYEVVLYVGSGVTDSNQLDVQSTWTGVFFLVAAVLAFVIGARFRSWWWGVGPLAARVLPETATWVLIWARGFDNEVLSWGFVFVIVSVIHGSMFSLAALAGVWWGKRRRLPDGAAHHVGSGDRSPTPVPGHVVGPPPAPPRLPR